MLGMLAPGTSVHPTRRVECRSPFALELGALLRGKHAGALAAEEKAELERGWKVEFERALAPDFTLNDGSGEILTGDCARAAYHRWADIPDKLVRRWSAARRRRARGKRQPVAPSADSEEAAAIK